MAHRSVAASAAAQALSEITYLRHDAETLDETELISQFERKGIHRVLTCAVVYVGIVLEPIDIVALSQAEGVAGFDTDVGDCTADTHRHAGNLGVSRTDACIE